MKIIKSIRKNETKAKLTNKHERKRNEKMEHTGKILF